MEPINPVQVGLCGWADHGSHHRSKKKHLFSPDAVPYDLYPPGTPSREKLAIYAGHFPVVEVDSTYHAIPSVERIERWAQETPDDFHFVVKVYRELTGHGRTEKSPIRSWRQMVKEMRTCIQPMVQAQKMSMPLFQFPPWYRCEQKHVQYIRRLRESFHDIRLAIEFRNQSWFRPEVCDRTLYFLEEEQWVHVICDEPQAGEGSVPLVLATTNREHSLVRFHGRNAKNWNQTGLSHWRDVRYAYRYSENEIEEWVEHVHELKKQTKQVTLLFNNNSQGDAIDSANMMVQKLKLQFKGLAQRQLSFLL